MTRRIFIAALVGLSAVALLPARAAGKRVALLPARTWNAEPENGRILTDALRASLEQHGFEVVAAREVDSAVRAGKMDLAKIQTVGALSALRSRMGVDYVIYPRVLSAGKGVNAKGEQQANILVNVTGESGKSFVWTRQVGQVIRAGSGSPAVIAHEDADEAAGKLLDGFYAKVK
jgi:hypothetical protein